jgi:diguanylate cyclase (GGDEF)-like protein
MKLLIVLSATIFGAEIAIMYGLQNYGQLENTMIESIIDATILTAVLFPALYFLVFRKMIGANSALESSQQALRRAHGELEHRVEERTRELTDSRRDLEKSLADSRRSHLRLRSLGETSRMLQACADLEEAGRVIQAQLQTLAPGAPGALYIFRASRDSLMRSASWNAEGGEFAEHIAPGECWGMRQGKTHVGGKQPGRLHCTHFPDRERDTVCVPLAAAGETLGMICLCRGGNASQAAQAAAASHDDFVAVLSTLGESLALSISNIRLRDTLRAQALRDRLTGLFNRRFIDETLALELSRSARSDSAFSIAMLDVDHFKNFNDTHGHEAGDLVLSALGQHFSTNMRGSDVACRYGGEEFMVLMPATSASGAANVIEKLRRSVEVLRVRLDDRRELGVTISCGVASYPEHARDAEALVRAADSALYASKHAGRNRVTVAEAGAIERQALATDGARQPVSSA